MTWPWRRLRSLSRAPRQRWQHGLAPASGKDTAQRFGEVRHFAVLHVIDKQLTSREILTAIEPGDPVAHLVEVARLLSEHQNRIHSAQWE